MFSVFLSSSRNTRERLGELKKFVETLACGSCSYSFLVLIHSCFYHSIEHGTCFLFLKYKLCPIFISPNQYTGTQYISIAFKTTCIRTVWCGGVDDIRLDGH